MKTDKNWVKCLFAWYKATEASANPVNASSGSITTEAATLNNSALYIIPTAVVTAGDGSSATKVVYTDSQGDLFVATSSDSGTTWKATSASAPTGVGKYLELKFTFAVYTKLDSNDTNENGVRDGGEAVFAGDSVLLSAASAEVKALRNGEAHHYKVEMTGRGKIGQTSASNMYAATFNSTGDDVTTGSTLPATGSISANTKAITAQVTATIGADGTIADSETFYIGLDGSPYSCNVSAGDTLPASFLEEANAAGANTTATLEWDD